MTKIKKFIFGVIAQLVVLLKRVKYQNIFTLAFWRNGWKRITAIACSVAISILIIVLLISGQRNIGAQEAGWQIYHLAQNIRRYYQTRPDFWGLSTAYVIQQKIYPTDMLTDSDYLIGYFGNQVVVGADIDGNPVMPTAKQFVIAYKGLSKLQCVGLASNNFNRDFWLGIGAVSLANNQQTYTFSWSGTEHTLPVSKSQAKKLCSSNNNSIVFHFE